MMVDDVGFTTTTIPPLPSFQEVMNGDNGVRVLESKAFAMPQVAMTEGRFEQHQQELETIREKAEAEDPTQDYITGAVDEGRAAPEQRPADVKAVPATKFRLRGSAKK